MRAIARRVRKLETRFVDATGLIPHSDAWFDFYSEKLRRSIDGEDIECGRMPIEVFDRLVELADCQDLEQATELSKQSR